MRLRKLFFVAFLLLACCALASAAPRKGDFKVLCDTLTARCRRNFGVRSTVALKSVTVRGNSIDFYFSPGLSDFPWHEADAKWFLSELDKGIKKKASGYTRGEVFCQTVKFQDLVTPKLGSSGKCSPSYASRRSDPRGPRLVRKVGSRDYNRGLGGRHIALWQSHGLYYNADLGLWKWQRAPLHRTVEDLYTQSYVLPFLIPMLENAGAVVMTPRERDTQVHEVICDNDPCFKGPREGLVRRSGRYVELGKWESAGQGFADAHREYAITDNPFRMGTARKAECGKASTVARWIPDIPVRGEYCVYVSYKTLDNSTAAARYTVKHLGGSTSFDVNQRMGGGTWVCLGRFEFAPGADCCVELSAAGQKGKVVTADAVKFGGGMGKIVRGEGVSNMPAYTEGASYWMPWAGADSTLRAWEGDYTNDYATRGAWTKMMKKQKGVPFDCSLAFHTDAGTTPNDSIVGTLAIYTLKEDGKLKFEDGTDRISSRTLTEYVQSQVVDDIRRDFEPEWRRRQLWDRSYSESRTTGVPAVLLELLSHHNFADMKYGLDPAFRFTVSRSVYKGILKFLSELYGCPYVVQPLPVHAFSAVLDPAAARVKLSWEPVADVSEKTAAPRGYRVYTRIDDGAFDDGLDVPSPSVALEVKPGHIYSYKVTAWNDGGESFPSEILSASMGEGPCVLVVNNFDRVSPPTWFDTPTYAGFDARTDSGVPYICDINYIGENYEFRRSLSWTTDENPGFGGSYLDKVGLIVAGNTFDYPYVHGRSLHALGKSFCSMSRDAFCALDSAATASFGPLDLICGKQVTVMVGRGAAPSRHEVFPEALRSALESWTSGGHNVLISGNNIATDAYDRVYPLPTPPADTLKKFVRDVLGYSLASSFGTGLGKVGNYEFYNSPNAECYSVESPDGLNPVKGAGKVWLRYPGSSVPAGVLHSGKGYKVASLGVPLECLKQEDARTALIGEAFDFFEK